jgi:uncharacterized protein
VRVVDAVLEPRGVCLRLELPQTHRERVRGLLGRDAVGDGQGMLFERTRSVHTVGMRTTIAVAFLDTGRRVLEVRRLVPWRLAVCLRARHVLECAEGIDVRPGDRLRIAPPETRARDR